ncbi:MAG: hypothetical protein IMW97_06620 [Firmicutes bacterium]|nr:hypothetical protein [Candidatus Fermentithermobacillaceae bacterium]
MKKYRLWCLASLTFLFLAVPGTALARYYYYYEGIVDLQTTYVPAGYYMGCVSTENYTDDPQELWYIQRNTKTVTASVSGSTRFTATVKADALTVLEQTFGHDYGMSVTWSQGTEMGVKITVRPGQGGKIEGYVYKGRISGKEKVRVEYYPDEGQYPPPNANGDPGHDRPSILEFPVVTYEYNNFSACYPSRSEYHFRTSTWTLPPK